MIVLKIPYKTGLKCDRTLELAANTRIKFFYTLKHKNKD